MVCMFVTVTPFHCVCVCVFARVRAHACVCVLCDSLTVWVSVHVCVLLYGCGLRVVHHICLCMGALVLVHIIYMYTLSCLGLPYLGLPCLGLLSSSVIPWLDLINYLQSSLFSIFCQSDLYLHLWHVHLDSVAQRFLRLAYAGFYQ